MMLHQPNEIIAERYQIVATCARGSFHHQITTVTYTAFDIHESRSVMLTAYSVEEAIDWKTVKSLFEREANLLLSLNHPSIPRYVSYFKIDNIDTDQKCHFYLVKELVTGKSLAKLVADGWNPDETKVKKLAIELLNTLNYLHSRSIIHQNIEPEHIILGENDRVYLTNLGGIKNTFSYRRMRGILPDRRVAIVNVALTYQPMECCLDKLVPASDLYSVGYCLIHLLSGKSPRELLGKLTISPNAIFPEKLDLTPYIKVSPGFQRWLEKMVEHRTQDRFDSAAAAIRAMPIRLLAESIKLTSYQLVKRKLAIAYRLNYLKCRFLKGLGDRNSGKKVNSTMTKVVTAIVGLFTLPEFTVVGISIWLFYLACVYIVIRYKIWT